MKIYFAASIRGGRDDKELYLQIIALLGAYGQVLTEHIGDTALSAMGEAGDAASIYERDMAWLAEADVVVAEVTQPSLGVGYELAKMEDVKPVLCLYRPQEGKSLSAMVTGNTKMHVREYASISDIKSILRDFLLTRLPKLDLGFRNKSKK